MPNLSPSTRTNSSLLLDMAHKVAVASLICPCAEGGSRLHGICAMPFCVPGLISVLLGKLILITHAANHLTS